MLFSMKFCPHCQHSFDESNFYTHLSATGIKLSSYCKPCVRALSSEWAKSNRAKKREINHRWRKKNQRRNNVANHAHAAVFKAIKSGTLVRPNMCSRCGATGVKIEAAHLSYETSLDVLWLCQSCHRLWDSQSPKTKTSYAASYSIRTQGRPRKILKKSLEGSYRLA